MWLYGFLSLCLLHNVNGNIVNVNDGICSSVTDEYIFINSMDDLKLLKNCSNIEGSLFINGGHDINDLISLSNLHTITGSFYLIYMGFII